MGPRAWMAAAILMTIGAAQPAVACSGPKVLFQDNFAQADPAWDLWERAAVENGFLKLTPQTGVAPVVYKGELFDRADICVDMVTPTYQEAQKYLGGLIFSAKGYADYYVVWISPTGNAGVLRRTNGKWLQPVSGRQAAGIVAGPGAKNRLRLTINNGAATLYINDSKWLDFRFNAVEGGGFIGAWAEGDGVWQFGNLKVTDLPR